MAAVVATVSACVSVPHAAHVRRGFQGSVTAGGGAVAVDQCGSDCSPAPVGWEASATGQLALGYGWRRTLGYVVIPVAHPAALDGQSGKHRTPLQAAQGAALAVYRQITAVGRPTALGVGMMVTPIGPPMGQLYVMVGRERRGWSVDGGARAGVAKTFRNNKGLDNLSAGAGVFMALRVWRGGGPRVGLWLDAWLASANDLLEEGQLSVTRSLVAGVLIESR